MARAWMVALVAVLVVSLGGCIPSGKGEEPAKKGGTVEIRVPVTEKKPEPPKPKPKPETPVVVTPKVEKPAPKAVTVELKRGTGIDLTEFLNSDGISTEANRQDSDFDQYGQSFPAEELPKAGNLCKPELPVCFVFPAGEPKAKNNVACAGQTIPLSGKRKAMHLLITATDANQEAQVAIEFADGKVEKDLKVTDWCGEPAFGEKVAVATKHRVASKPDASGLFMEEKAAKIWCVTVPLDAKREVKAVKLPFNAQIHIFALSLD